jgi:hypothetical protein
MVSHNRKLELTTGSALVFLFLLIFSGISLSAVQPVSSANAEAYFTVYPDGSMELASRGNVTNLFPSSVSVPAVHFAAQVGRNDDRNSFSANTTIALSPEQIAQFPFNSTTVSMSAQYSNGIVNSGANASIILPKSLPMQGLPMNVSGFPFDSLDFSLNSAYANQSFNGTITVHLLPGFTLGDVNLDFEGNLTEVIASDSVEVFYNYTLPIPGFPLLNETYLTQLLHDFSNTVLGRGPGSIYNMTSGALECTTFNATIASVDANRARVSFFVVVQGDLIQFLINMYSELLRSTSSLLPPGSMPTPSLNLTTLYALTNASVYSTKSQELTMIYSKANREFYIETRSSSDMREYWNSTAGILSSLYPSSMQPFVQSMLNTTFISMNSLQSLNETVSYNDGTAILDYAAAFTGDLNGEVDYLKNAFINMTEQTLGGQIAFPEEMLPVLKETTFDISNMKLSFDIQNSSIMWNLENVRVTPPTDPINATSFKLRRFFDLAYSSNEPPFQNQQLKLIVQGGSNATHSVIMSIDQTDFDKPPSPDEFGDNNTIIWNNMSISKLRSLIFTFRQGSAATIFRAQSVTPSNPFTVNAMETAGCTLTVTNISEPTTITITNTTSPPDQGSAQSSYKLVGSYVQISTDTNNVTVNATLHIYYSSEQLAASGLSESDLRIYYWNTTTNSWTALSTNINTTEHCAWTVVNHLSTWAILEQPSQSIWQQPWFILSIAVVIAVVIVVTVAVLRRKKPSSTGNTAEISQQTQ